MARPSNMCRTTRRSHGGHVGPSRDDTALFRFRRVLVAPVDHQFTVPSARRSIYYRSTIDSGVHLRPHRVSLSVGRSASALQQSFVLPLRRWIECTVSPRKCSSTWLEGDGAVGCEGSCHRDLSC
jgi:hypothetical protein